MSGVYAEDKVFLPIYDENMQSKVISTKIIWKSSLKQMSQIK